MQKNVRKWYEGNYIWDVGKHFFDEDEQDEVLCKIGIFGSRRDFTHYAEDTEELKVTAARAKS